jgi:ParB family chromosome partitioning protein
MATHQLKIREDYARAHLSGVKPWELRKNDRNFKIGDKIDFSAIDDQGFIVMTYSRTITFIFKGGQYGLNENYAILTLTDGK